MALQSLFEAPAVIQIHVYAALAATVLGAAILFRRKGTPRHRLAGKIWVGLMVVVSLSSFGIHEIMLWGLWSPIHILSIVTLISLAVGVQRARRHDMTGHRFTMQATYFGALVIAGAFTLFPGRLMYEVLFGGETSLAEIAGRMTATARDAPLWVWLLPAALIAGGWWLSRRRGVRRPAS